MKSINVIFEDEEFKHLEVAKANFSWREFILNLSDYKKEDEYREA